MAKKKPEEKEVDPASRLTVMMVSLNLILVVFFVYINSIGTNDESRVKKVLGSLVGRFGILPEGFHLTEGKTLLPPGAPLMSPDEQKVDIIQIFKELIARRKLVDRKKANPDGDISKKREIDAEPEEIELSVRGDDLVIILSDKILFPSGTAELYAGGRTMLDSLSGAFHEYPFPIRVEGYTDDRAVSSERFPSNWELSAARAIAVTRYLMEVSGIPAKRLMAVGFGEYHPLVPNDTPENRAKNRIVKIVLVGGKAGGG